MTPELIAKVTNYTTPQASIDLIRSVPTVIFSGITAAGKDTIITHLTGRDDYHRIVTCTTRQPRMNNDVMETDGVSYHFLDIKTAENMIDEGKFIEVKKVHDNMYGTGVSEFETASRDRKVAIGDVDVQGADEFLRLAGDNVYVVFVVPPSFEVWFERLKGRYGGTLEGRREDITSRFMSAKKEIAHALAKPGFIPVMNIDSATTAETVDRIVRRNILPTESEIAQARHCLHGLYDGLENYIEVLSSKE